MIQSSSNVSQHPFCRKEMCLPWIIHVSANQSNNKEDIGSAVAKISQRAYYMFVQSVVHILFLITAFINLEIQLY